MEAVLLLQAKINDYEDDRMNLRLLVPNKVIGCLIGRGGSIVNDMRKKTKANILISKGDKPRRASSSDELVEVRVLICLSVYKNLNSLGSKMSQIVIWQMANVCRYLEKQTSCVMLLFR